MATDLETASANEPSQTGTETSKPESEDTSSPATLESKPESEDTPTPATLDPKTESEDTPTPAPLEESDLPAPTLIYDRGDTLAVLFFLVVFVMSLIGIFNLFRDFLNDIILGLVFSALSSGPYQSLVRLTKRPLLAATCVCFLIILLLAVPITFLIITLSVEAAGLIGMASSVSVDRLNELIFGEGWIAEMVSDFSRITKITITEDSVREFITTTATSLAGVIYETVNSIFTNILSGLFHFLIIIAMIFYLLIDGQRFRRFIYRLSPMPDHHEALLLDRFGDVGRAILFGNGIGSAIQGVLGALAMMAVGLPSPILWGTIMTIFAFLPIVGISIVVVPASIYLILNDRQVAAAVFFLFCSFVSLVVDNVVKTRLMGRNMQMHDLLIFLSVIGGLAVYGVLGLLYGPLLVTLFLTLADLYETEYKYRIRDPIAKADLGS